MKQAIILLIFPVAFQFSSCSPDKARVSTIGRVIDYDTQLPIDSALVTDSGYGSQSYTDSLGRFKVVGLLEKQKIAVKKENYKPFNIEIRTESDIIYLEKHKTYRILNKEIYDIKRRIFKRLNSNTFKVINGDSLIIELKKLENNY